MHGQICEKCHHFSFSFSFSFSCDCPGKKTTKNNVLVLTALLSAFPFLCHCKTFCSRTKSVCVYLCMKSACLYMHFSVHVPFKRVPVPDLPLLISRSGTLCDCLIEVLQGRPAEVEGVVCILGHCMKKGCNHGSKPRGGLNYAWLNKAQGYQ